MSKELQITAKPQGNAARESRQESAQAEALAEQARVLALLYDIGKELTSILAVDELLRAVGERVRALVEYDLLSVLLLNQETGRLEHSLSLRYDQRILLRTTLAPGEGLCGTAVLERTPIRVGRVKCDARYIRCESGLPVESELVVPLIAKDRVLGVLDLESLRPDAFTAEHEQTLVTLASTVAIALENAFLYDELRRTEQRRKEDLERARDVQRLLLPRSVPHVQGLDLAALYYPALELGGDFYDFLPYGDGRVAIVAGDVAGKGSAAALLASLGIGILREHAIHLSSPPAEMLADLNGHLQGTGSQGRFIAMAFAVYDSATRELSLASAGFPQPLLVRRGSVTTINVAGLPLGLFPDSAYDAVHLRLEPGDVVVFCSDGIHEQTNGLDEEFGLERLVALLAGTGQCAGAEWIASEIIRALDEHAGSRTNCGDCKDDRTIVVLRVQ